MKQCSTSIYNFPREVKSQIQIYLSNFLVVEPRKSKRWNSLCPHIHFTTRNEILRRFTTLQLSWNEVTIQTYF